MTHFCDFLNSTKYLQKYQFKRITIGHKINSLYICFGLTLSVWRCVSWLPFSIVREKSDNKDLITGSPFRKKINPLFFEDTGSKDKGQTTNTQRILYWTDIKLYTIVPLTIQMTLVDFRSRVQMSRVKLLYSLINIKILFRNFLLNVIKVLYDVTYL